MINGPKGEHMDDNGTMGAGGTISFQSAGVLWSAGRLPVWNQKEQRPIGTHIELRSALGEKWEHRIANMRTWSLRIWEDISSIAYYSLH